MDFLFGGSAKQRTGGARSTAAAVSGALSRDNRDGSPASGGPTCWRSSHGPFGFGVGLGLAVMAGFAGVAAHAQPPLAAGEVLVERTILPEAHASSFAFGLPGGVSFCYDPTRGGLNYAWTGGFIDLTNVRPINKLVKPATLTGSVVYRESGMLPLRRADAARVPTVEFKGYTLKTAAVELRYTVDGVFVTEEIRANPTNTGLVRKFKFDRAGGDATWYYVVDGKPATTLTKDAAGVFTLDVPFAKSAP